MCSDYNITWLWNTPLRVIGRDWLRDVTSPSVDWENLGDERPGTSCRRTEIKQIWFSHTAQPITESLKLVISWINNLNKKCEETQTRKHHWLPCSLPELEDVILIIVCCWGAAAGVLRIRLFEFSEFQNGSTSLNNWFAGVIPFEFPQDLYTIEN